MEDLQRIIVRDHIADLYRDGEALRAERFRRDHSPGHNGAEDDAPARRGPSPARVRVGRWLIGVGNVVAGGTGDKHEGAAGHAA